MEYAAWADHKAEAEQSLLELEAEESAKRGEYIPAEEVFAEIGLTQDEKDDIADRLKHNVSSAIHEFNLYNRRREAQNVREILSDA